MTVYHPMEQEMNGGRLFIHAKMDPYALVPAVTKVIRELATDQPVERAATLDDIRAEVLAPNAGQRAGVRRIRRRRAAHRGRRRGGRAGVLGERADARVRRAAGDRLDADAPADARPARRRRDRYRRHRRGRDRRACCSRGSSAASCPTCRCPGSLPIAGAAFVLVVAAIVASLTPAARASRVDVVCALRAE